MLFVFTEVAEADTRNYHPEGGVVVVAESLERARELVAAHKRLTISEAEWAEVIIAPEDQVFVFPNTGCC